MLSALQSPSKRQGGFTLIELMVVSLVIVLITSTIALKLTAGGKKAMKEEARRMSALVRLASEQALLQGRDIGMVIEDNGYQFFLFDVVQRRWVGLGNERVFRSRKLPDNIRMELSIEENEVTWPDPDEVDEDDSDDDSEEEIVVPTPQILLLSSGEITPFDLYFEMDDVEPAFHLSVLPDGTRELNELEFGY